MCPCARHAHVLRVAWRMGPDRYHGRQCGKRHVKQMPLNTIQNHLTPFVCIQTNFSSANRCSYVASLQTRNPHPPRYEACARTRMPDRRAESTSGTRRRQESTWRVGGSPDCPPPLTRGNVGKLAHHLQHEARAAHATNMQCAMKRTCVCVRVCVCVCVCVFFLCSDVHSHFRHQPSGHAP